ncbi:glutathione S-transferase Gst3 [Paracoccidioides lutzii Pb01]|uniref:Glutathione S-transferase Gst3 n=1 Tax=Paracoccidioides lutzii (strain ATCC MYA-826 / Pb01) TaxID=502779 RepID=C1GZI7_PARBA|nr:glutathione S-transferase Gst3 [Paracoccidioides lutzii Pb01]EEH42010.1 glutathione S-transferase Gst3 [Paracoccidioides lutzii Pb01]
MFSLLRTRQLLSLLGRNQKIVDPKPLSSSLSQTSHQFSTTAKADMATGNDDKITNWVSPSDTTGEFKREQSALRNWISREPGAQFPPEKGRYHLYVSYACPWAHRTLIVRKLKGLEDIIPFTAVHWHLGDMGWRFATPEENLPGENVRPDPVHEGFTHLRQIYFKVDPEYKGRFTVPALYDVKTGRIVSNESSEIIRMFYHEFDDFLPEKYKKVDLLPQNLRKDIEETNEWTYNDVNNGVYKCGFATTQSAYEKAMTTLFTSLDRIESHLQSRFDASSSKTSPIYYFGDSITEADVRLYTTIARFDAVYVQHFKTNIRDIRSGYPALHRWLRHLYWDIPAFHDTTQFEHIKKHYTKSHTQINQFGITPVGPLPDILPKDQEVATVMAVKK